MVKIAKIESCVGVDMATWFQCSLVTAPMAGRTTEQFYYELVQIVSASILNDIESAEILDVIDSQRFAYELHHLCNAYKAALAARK